MYPGAHVLLIIVLRTAAIYAVVLLGVRLSGKREVGQMTPFDLTLLLLISNAVQNAMTGPDTSLLGGVIAACTLLVMNYFVADLSGANRRFRKLIEGQPSLLIHDGQVMTAHMAKEHVSMDELERSLREHGIASYHDVALACPRSGWLDQLLEIRRDQARCQNPSGAAKIPAEASVARENAQSLGEDQRNLLIRAGDRHSQRFAFGEVIRGNGKAHDDHSLGLGAGLHRIPSCRGGVPAPARAGKAWSTGESPRQTRPDR